MRRHLPLVLVVATCFMCRQGSGPSDAGDTDPFVDGDDDTDPVADDEDDSGHDTGGEEVAVPVFSRDILFLTIGDPVEGVPVAAGWQDALDGWHYAFSYDGEGDPFYECQHDKPQMEEKTEEWDLPGPVDPCKAPDPTWVDTDAPVDTDLPGDTDPPEPYTGQPGANPMPVGSDGWAGRPAGGGCGTWATLMCDRILGRVDPETPVTEDEWNAVATAIKQNDDGGSNRFDRAEYYQGRGYCVAMQPFDGEEEDYEELVEKVQSGECDVKAAFGRRTPEGEYVDGHTEVVTGATMAGMVTNSWGQAATIEGGSQNGFKHSGDGRWFLPDGGGPGKVWPPDATELTITYVCPCTFWDDLGNLILGN